MNGSSPVWIKSSYSGGDSPDCVEVAALSNGRAVRDSKDPHGPMLMISSAQWAAFTTGARSGAFG